MAWRIKLGMALVAVGASADQCIDHAEGLRQAVVFECEHLYGLELERLGLVWPEEAGFLRVDDFLIGANALNDRCMSGVGSSFVGEVGVRLAMRIESVKERLAELEVTKESTRKR